MRVARLALRAIAALAGISPALAFDDTPKPNLNMSCVRFNEFSRARDPGLMRSLSGVWEAEFDVAAVPGVFRATRQQTRFTRNPDGSLLYERHQCFHPIGVAGLPPPQDRCASAIGHGLWYARPDDGGGFAIGVWLQGSDFSGYRVGPNCTLVRGRFLDANTIENEDGLVGRRVGAAQ